MTPTETTRDVLKKVRQILSMIECSPYTFYAECRGDEIFIQADYLEKDVYDKDPMAGLVRQTTRKWFISRHATKSEVVQTALKCALTSAEHRVREAFLYKNRRVYGPHISVETLWQVCPQTDVRVDKEP